MQVSYVKSETQNQTSKADPSATRGLQGLSKEGRHSGPEELFGQHSLHPPSHSHLPEKTAFFTSITEFTLGPTQLSHLCSVFIAF